MPDLIFSPLAIAPMIDWTYSHFRVFMRILAPQALLYTEMQTCGAIQNNPRRALEYFPKEHPLALQLGGSDPHALAQCAKQAEQEGYDEVNLNLGCPSDRVKAGQFGACLMQEPVKVMACIQAMRDAVSIPVSAKIRIGIDENDSYAFFRDFAARLQEAGSQKIIVHARKAWLQGLSPKQNRTIPPINYDYVYQLKKDMPDMPLVLNGNIVLIEDIQKHLGLLQGVMLGRLACDNPYQIAKIHQVLYPENPILSRSEAFSHYLKHMLAAHQQGVPLTLLLKPVFNLAYGLAGSSQWKQQLMAVIQSKSLATADLLMTYLENIEASHSSVGLT